MGSEPSSTRAGGRPSAERSRTPDLTLAGWLDAAARDRVGQVQPWKSSRCGLLVRTSGGDGKCRASPFTVEESNECLGVPECVVYWMVIVFRPPQTLPLLCASKVAHQPCVVVGDPSSGMPERVLSKVAPEIEVDPLEVVGWIVRHEHDRAPRVQPFTELPERVFRAVDAVKCLHAPIPKRVDVDSTELRHVADRGGSDAERRFAVNDNQMAHRVINDRPVDRRIR